MNRREFIETCSLGIAAMTAGCAMLDCDRPEPIEIPENILKLGADQKTVQSLLPLRSRVNIPEWANREIETALKRYRAWKGDDMTVAFPVITDVHSHQYDFRKDFSFADSKMHTLLVQLAGEKGGADFIADLGDSDLDIGIPITNDWPPKFRFCTPEEMEYRVAIQVALYSETPLPVLFMVGNHDHSQGRFSNERFGASFNIGVTRKKGFRTELGPNGDYGWYDIKKKKMRVIFLNSSEEGYYGYSVDQLRFLVRALESIGDGWTAMVLQHFCIQPIGRWSSFPTTFAKRQEIAAQIMEGFVARKAGEAGGVSWNFTEKQNSYLAGFLCGDSHFDNYGKFNGVDYSITQGYGTIRDVDMIPGAYKTRVFNRNEQMLVDFVAIKPASHEVRFFRIGEGGEARDRGYRY